MSEPKASELKKRKVMMFDRKVGDWHRYVINWTEYDTAVRELATRVIATGHRVRQEIHPLTKERRYGIYTARDGTWIDAPIDDALIYADTLDELIPHMKLLGGGDDGEVHKGQDR